jgi:hypothetical protein
MTERLDGADLIAGVGPSRSMLMDVSDEMVRFYKQQFGRGPTSVRTIWAGRMP